MEIIPIEFCDNCNEYIHLNQKQLDCAFEHQCESSMECPLKRFFSKTIESEPGLSTEQNDMPSFYITDL